MVPQIHHSVRYTMAEVYDHTQPTSSSYTGLFHVLYGLQKLSHREILATSLSTAQSSANQNKK